MSFSFLSSKTSRNKANLFKKKAKQIKTSAKYSKTLQNKAKQVKIKDKVKKYYKT